MTIVLKNDRQKKHDLSQKTISDIKHMW